MIRSKYRNDKIKTRTRSSEKRLRDELFGYSFSIVTQLVLGGVTALRDSWAGLFSVMNYTVMLLLSHSYHRHFVVSVWRIEPEIVL